VYRLLVVAITLLMTWWLCISDKPHPVAFSPSISTDRPAKYDNRSGPTRR
jgi:hypothetical protein